MALNDLSDVSGTPSDGQVLTFSNGGWAPADPPAGGGGGDVDVLNDLDDVSGTPTAGQVLTYDGAGWAPATPSTGGGGGNGPSPTPFSLTAGQFLSGNSFDGSAAATFNVASSNNMADKVVAQSYGGFAITPSCR